MSDYEMKSTFDIDDGELYGIELNKIFVLGFELGQIHSWVDNETTIKEFYAHNENVERVIKCIEENDIDFEYELIDDTWNNFILYRKEIDYE